jgi:hypothetical protein
LFKVRSERRCAHNARTVEPERGFEKSKKMGRTLFSVEDQDPATLHGRWDKSDRKDKSDSPDELPANGWKKPDGVGLSPPRRFAMKGKSREGEREGWIGGLNRVVCGTGAVPAQPSPSP